MSKRKPVQVEAEYASVLVSLDHAGVAGGARNAAAGRARRRYDLEYLSILSKSDENQEASSIHSLLHPFVAFSVQSANCSIHFQPASTSRSLL